MITIERFALAGTDARSDAHLAARPALPFAAPAPPVLRAIARAVAIWTPHPRAPDAIEAERAALLEDFAAPAAFGQVDIVAADAAEAIGAFRAFARAVRGFWAGPLAAALRQDCRPMPPAPWPGEGGAAPAARLSPSSGSGRPAPRRSAPRSRPRPCAGCR